MKFSLNQLVTSLIFLLVIGIFVSCSSRFQLVYAANFTVSPSNSIQTAIDAATSGDTILLDDGSYYQKFTVTKPLTVKAKNGGKATLSGAYNGTLNFTSVGNDIYTAPVAWPVKWVMHGEKSLLDYVDLSCLQSNLYPSCPVSATNNVIGPDEGFFYDATQQVLYLKLLNSTNPNSQQIEINRDESSYEPGIRGVGITIQASNVTIEGLRLRLWYGGSLQVDNQEYNGNFPRQNIRITHNYFQASGRPIWISTLLTAQKDFVIEYNEFSNYPIFQYRLAAGNQGWSKLYGSNLATTAIYGGMSGMVIRHNYIHEMFDGILTRGDGGNGNDTWTTTEIEKSYNVIQNIVDNPIEVEPIMKVAGVWKPRYWRGRVHHNFILDAYSIFSLTGVQHGYVTVDHNIVYNAADYSAPDYTKTTICKPNRLFKFGDNVGADSAPYGAMTLVHNTVVLCDGTNDGADSSLYSYGKTSAGTYRPFSNSIMQNNIFLVDTLPFGTYDLLGMIFADENIIKGSAISASLLSNALHSDPQFVSTSPQIDFHLKSGSQGSPALNYGTTNSTYFQNNVTDGSPDLGALEGNEPWQMPQPGPSWVSAANPILDRPAIPASLSSNWLGLSGSAVPTPTAIAPTPVLDSNNLDGLGNVDLTDIILLIQYIFDPLITTIAYGADPDINESGGVNLLDVIDLISVIFS